MLKIKPWMLSALICFASLLAIASCSKVNQKNLDKIKAGMRYEEVTAILGSPSNCDSVLGGKSCAWKSGNKSIDIKFLSDKVIFYAGKNLGG